MSRWSDMTPEQKARHNEKKKLRRKTPGSRDNEYLTRRKRPQDVVGDARRRAKRWGRPTVPVEQPTRPRPTLCEICGDRNPKRGLHFDHCHTTGRFRGWLCQHCNTGLGQAQESIDILQLMISYLERGGPEDCRPPGRPPLQTATREE